MKSIKDQAGCMGTRCVAIAVLLASAVNTWPQGTFQNLNFESAVLIPTSSSIPAVQFAQAFPSWTGYRGTQQLTVALHNTTYLSSPIAAISIFTPNQKNFEPLEGHFAVFRAGYESYSPGIPPGEFYSVALEQTGQIPPSAKSLRFLAYGDFSVSFAGQPLNLTVLERGPYFHGLVGADISAFAGTSGKLRFEANGGLWSLDSIQFSSQSIPEPGIATLGVLGAGLLGWLWRKRARVSV